ncbi:MAG TPA: UDP-glucuronic acid decarboxylase family protein [Steroidobacter sp.]|uniref:UDP-glucuronic acid decarboxylase family protein n=1 Tax=Steroidobacter sp. TaxID=1978227 RepID=UPI002ED77233
MSTAIKKQNGGEGAKSVVPRRPILVCGGAGFLGSHLCARLLAEGEPVLCVDNFCTSDPESVEHLLSHPNFELMRGDVMSLDEGQFGDVAAIFNLACAASPVLYQRNPLDTFFSSVRGVDTLLRVARRCGVKLFQASTSEIYGHPTVHPQSERYWGHVNTVGPRACYDEGKRCAETLCFIYRQEFGVAARIARIFNTYGPGMSLQDGRVVINFISQALSDAPLTVYGDGTQTRSFCYVDDLIDGIMRIMGAPEDFGGPVNIGNPAEIRVRELAERVIKLTGSRSRIQMRPLPVDDPPRRRPDISLAISALDWRPRTDLDAGLMMTIRDVQRRLRRGDMSLRGTKELSSAATPLAGVNAI